MERTEEEDDETEGKEKGQREEGLDLYYLQLHTCSHNLLSVCIRFHLLSCPLCDGFSFCLAYPCRILIYIWLPTLLIVMILPIATSNKYFLAHVGIQYRKFVPLP